MPLKVYDTTPYLVFQICCLFIVCLSVCMYIMCIYIYIATGWGTQLSPPSRLLHLLLLPGASSARGASGASGTGLLPSPIPHTLYMVSVGPFRNFSEFGSSSLDQLPDVQRTVSYWNTFLQATRLRAPGKQDSPAAPKCIPYPSKPWQRNLCDFKASSPCPST